MMTSAARRNYESSVIHEAVQDINAPVPEDADVQAIFTLLATSVDPINPNTEQRNASASLDVRYALGLLEAFVECAPSAEAKTMVARCIAQCCMPGKSDKETILRFLSLARDLYIYLLRPCEPLIIHSVDA